MSEPAAERNQNPKRYEDGFRILQGKQEYVTYPEDSSFRVWYADSPWKFEIHRHSAVEVVLTLEGTVEVTVEGTCYTVREREVIIIPPDMSHEISMGEGSRRLLFLYEPDGVYGLRDVKRAAKGLDRLFVLRDGADVLPEIRRLLLDIWQVYRTGEPMWNTWCYSCVLRIYALLGREYLRVQENDDRNGSSVDPEVIAGAMSYINSHYRDDLTLDEVANFAGFSRYYFSRCFRQQTGYTFREYLSQKRLQVATDLLIRSRKSMQEVAEESGFGSVATFNRVFREARDCTPTQYRAIHGIY
ncbi:MAG: AraC family transcriptional regulator [Clostridia bacterium]|nr:AraC family transcriptional regulator [Clostridia bacterium]